MEKTFDELVLLKFAQADPSLKVRIVSHPLIRQALAIIRDKNTDLQDFRAAVFRLTPPLVYAATADLSESEISIETPLSPIVARKVKDRVVLIPILRSGIGMHEPAMSIFPGATTVFAGLNRDESTAIAHWYYALKELKHLNGGEDTVFLILDPMLATGGSADETAAAIKKIYPQGRVKLVSIIAAPEGIKHLNTTHPDLEITVAAVDDHLNKAKYIVPGLGDAGDRQFGTV